MGISILAKLAKDAMLDFDPVFLKSFQFKFDI
jgi:hypothetical protein